MLDNGQVKSLNGNPSCKVYYNIFQSRTNPIIKRQDYREGQEYCTRDNRSNIKEQYHDQSYRETQSRKEGPKKPVVLQNCERI